MTAVLLPEPRAKFAPAVRSETAVHLSPGQVFFARTPANIITILGSCVAVALWDPESGVGGMNHYLLPRCLGGTQSAKYGDVASALLLAQFARAGIPVSRLEAKVFGGACVIEAFRRRGDDLGAQNIGAAYDFLTLRGIPIVEEDVRGSSGMRICFRTEDGSVSIRHLGDER